MRSVALVCMHDRDMCSAPKSRSRIEQCQLPEPILVSAEAAAARTVSHSPKTRFCYRYSSYSVLGPCSYALRVTKESEKIVFQEIYKIFEIDDPDLRDLTVCLKRSFEFMASYYTSPR